MAHSVSAPFSQLPVTQAANAGALELKADDRNEPAPGKRLKTEDLLRGEQGAHRGWIGRGSGKFGPESVRDRERGLLE